LQTDGSPVNALKVDNDPEYSKYSSVPVVLMMSTDQLEAMGSDVGRTTVSSMAESDIWGS